MVYYNPNLNGRNQNGTVDAYIEHTASKLDNHYSELTLNLTIPDENPSLLAWEGELEGAEVLVVPPGEVEVINRIKLREDMESPTDGIRTSRYYNRPCIELSLEDFIDARNNLLSEYINNLGLSLNDWKTYVDELLDKLTLPKDDPIRKQAVTTLNSLLKVCNLSDKVPRPNSIFYNSTLIGISPSLFSALYETDSQFVSRRNEWVSTNLSKALFKITIEDFLYKVIIKAYPLPQIQQLKWENGTQILFPTCDNYKGVCCLYDEEQQEIAPGLYRPVKILKNCIPSTDEATCLNYTKRYSQSSTNATRGKFDLAEFTKGIDEYGQDVRTHGCDWCKSPVSIVYCSTTDEPSFPVIQRDLRIDILKGHLESLNGNYNNLEYFANSKDAEYEFNRRVKERTCAILPPQSDTPDSPIVTLQDCSDSLFSILITAPSGCNNNNNNNIINYVFYINDNPISPDSISWDPGPVGSPTSNAEAVFFGNYTGSNIYVTSSYCSVYDDDQVSCGKDSKPSNRISIQCITTTTTPTVNIFYGYLSS